MIQEHWMGYGAEEDPDKPNDDDNDGGDEEKKEEINNEEPEPVFVANLSEFSNSDRKTVHIPERGKDGKQKERPIIVVKANNHFFALDLRCYHVWWYILNLLTVDI